MNDNRKMIESAMCSGSSDTAAANLRAASQNMHGRGQNRAATGDFMQDVMANFHDIFTDGSKT